MAVGEAIEEARLGGHIECIIWLVIAQLINAVVGEVQRAIPVPVKAHSVPNACSAVSWW